MMNQLLVLIGVVCAVAAAKGHKHSKTQLFLDAAEKYVNDKPGLINLYAEYVKDKQNSQFAGILEGLIEYMQESDEYDRADAKKHVLTILSDDQGWADIGYVDNTFVSPTVDTLAGLGVKFNSFYVQVSSLGDISFHD
jgi:hypothetical protein